MIKPISFTSSYTIFEKPNKELTNFLKKNSIDFSTKQHQGNHTTNFTCPNELDKEVDTFLYLNEIGHSKIFDAKA